MTNLIILTEYRRDNYNLILIIVNRLIKIINKKLVITKIEITGQTDLIIDAILRYKCFLDSIIIDQVTLLSSKF